MIETINNLMQPGFAGFPTDPQQPSQEPAPAEEPAQQPAPEPTADELEEERKNEEENKKNILPPAEEDPSMVRTAMIMKLYPVVKKNYDDSELGHQQQI